MRTSARGVSMTAPPSQAAFAFALASLAVYRLSRMIALEAGPLDVFVRLHAAAERVSYRLVDGLSCPLCVGAWLALPAAMVWTYAVGGSILLGLAAWPAIAGAAAWLYLREGGE